LFCVLRGPTCGRPWGPAVVGTQLHQAAALAGVRRRFAPHQLRHAHCGADVARGGPAAGHPAPAGTRQPTPSPPSICVASTTPKSCTPSTNDPHPRSLSTTGFSCTDRPLGWPNPHPPHRRKPSINRELVDLMKASAALVSNLADAFTRGQRQGDHRP
jgi:hypothetical protein